MTIINRYQPLIIINHQLPTHCRIALAPLAPPCSGGGQWTAGGGQETLVAPGGNRGFRMVPDRWVKHGSKRG